MLALMRKKGGFGGYCVGVDYSEGSIELARELQRLKIHSAYWADDSSEGGEGQDEDEDEDDVVVAGAEGLGTPNTAEAIPVTGDTDIRFEVWDVLASEGVGLERLDWFPDSGFDIVLDKGTFDAISLSEETVPGSESKERVCERYPAIAKRTVRKGGFLVVTSCNWTEEELIRWFTKDDDGVEVRVWGRVEYPRFRFGGMEGQGVCTVCFERV